MVPPRPPNKRLKLSAPAAGTAMIERLPRSSVLAMSLASIASVSTAQITHREHNLGWANGAVTNTALDGRLSQAAIQYRSYAPVPRIAFYDIAFPEDCAEFHKHERPRGAGGDCGGSGQHRTATGEDLFRVRICGHRLAANRRRSVPCRLGRRESHIWSISGRCPLSPPVPTQSRGA